MDGRPMSVFRGAFYGALAWVAACLLLLGSFALGYYLGDYAVAGAAVGSFIIFVLGGIAYAYEGEVKHGDFY